MEAPERIKILLVDDRPENLCALESVLSRPDYELISVQSGPDALRFLLHNDCALILLDIQMPEMDGFEVARLVRGNDRTKTIPIIFVTAINKEPTFVAKGYEAGAVDYLFKPYDPDILRSKVAVFAELYRVRSQIARQAALLQQHERRERLRELQELELKSLRRERIAQRRYRELVEGITHAIIWSADPSTFLCSYASPSAETILGFPGEAWLEEPHFWRNRLHPDERTHVTALMAGLAEGEARVVEHRLMNSRGEWSWFQTALRLVREEDGNAELRGLSVDITQARQGEEALQFLARASSELLSSLELRHTVQRIASLVVPMLADWCTITITPREDSTESLHVVTHVDPSREAQARELDLCPEIASLTETSTLAVVTNLGEVLSSNGSVAEAVADLSPGSVVAVPLAIRGQTLGRIHLFCRSERSKYDRYHLTLAEEIGRRGSQAIENALLYGRAKEAIEVREEFLSIASHELKTPMTPMLLQMQSLDRLIATELPAGALTDKLLARLRASERHLERLDDLVEELLDVARLRTGRMTLQLESFDLRDLIDEVVARHRESLELAKTELTVQRSSSMVGRWDRLRLDQVLTNLVSNAIKYGGGTPIRVEARQLDGGVRITVADGGIGIAEPEKAKIFEPFERGSITKDYGGLGLGLYIARQIVDAHGGTISVQSQPGAGATFTLELPLSAEPSAESEAKLLGSDTFAARRGPSGAADNKSSTAA